MFVLLIIQISFVRYIRMEDIQYNALKSAKSEIWELRTAVSLKGQNNRLFFKNVDLLVF